MDRIETNARQRCEVEGLDPDVINKYGEPNWARFTSERLNKAEQNLVSFLQRSLRLKTYTNEDAKIFAENYVPKVYED